ncbi:MAG: DUF4294 domain-containing protein [Bacteroidales bacterium]|nr:DUF4294 domain-containing protein [Bacteroidales bacterium]
MNKKNILLIAVLFLSCAIVAAAQEKNKDMPFVVKVGPIIGADTLYEYTLPEVTIYPQKVFKSKRHKREYMKLLFNVRKVYPYAKMAGEKLKLYAPILDTLKTKRERDKYFDVIEDELWAEYGDKLKKFTVSQGAILIKLVDRECQRSTYQVLKDFRGGFSAFFYQSFARLWGYNLKVKYDAEGEDKDIEEIVLMIESGQL